MLDSGLRLLSGLQVRLFLAMSFVLFVAIFVTGSVFMYRDRLERREANLDRIATATKSFSVSAAPFNFAGSTLGLTPLPPTPNSPLQTGVSGDFTIVTGEAPAVAGGVAVGEGMPSMPSSGGVEAGDIVTTYAQIPNEQFVYRAAELRSVPYRIMLVNTDGEIVSDPSGALQGERISIPEVNSSDQARGYVTWKFEGAASQSLQVGDKGVTLLAGTKDLVSPGQNGLLSVAAIDTRSLTDDWLATLPQLAISGIFGIPISLLAAAVVTRRITKPLQQLTHAAEAMSRGDFDQRVRIAGRDEVATLASSFSLMAERVQDRDTQLRDLLANVSHDLRTPLTSIQGYAEALTDGVAEREEVDQAARIIRESAVHATHVLADLLVLSEIDAGQVVLHREMVDLGALVDRCLRRLEQRAAASNIELRRSPHGGPTVMGDADKIERAISNVLDNGVRYATGYVEVAWLTNHDAALTIRNDGPAIAASDAPHIFERHYRGQRSRGNGLGLAIATELLRLNDATIRLASADTPVEFRIKFHAVVPGIPHSSET